MYDVGWLDALGLKVHGRIIDTMIAAPLINENRFNYTLRDLSKEYVGETKSETLLYEAAKEWGVDAKSEMWKLPAMYVGPYAEQDAAVTLKLWKVLQREIVKQELTDIFNTESELFHVLFAMKKKGVRIDTEKAERIKKDFENFTQSVFGKETLCALKFPVAPPNFAQKGIISRCFICSSKRTINTSNSLPSLVGDAG